MLVVDDQAIVRKGIRALLAEVETIAVVGEATNGAEAVAQAQALDPDVTLMDLAMPVMDGIEAIRGDVLRLVATGLSNRDIAAQLTTTEATIKTHVSSILSKLHLANRVQATLYALQEGVTTLEDSPEDDV